MPGADAGSQCRRCAFHECDRRLVADGTTGLDRVVVLTPFLDFHAGVVKRQEPVCVEAFSAELAVERLDISGVSRSPVGMNEIHGPDIVGIHRLCPVLPTQKNMDRR